MNPLSLFTMRNMAGINKKGREDLPFIFVIYCMQEVHHGKHNRNRMGL